ncbi:phosphomannomutase [Ancylobacter sp. 3268]|uniref:phosphomannomutase n=1 Tax=Ancylobacter sp. 3268 TaxID=2817752 RepID=UPI00286A1405|nr:phosphomannomutase [Ancylobacter sp. 3268]
MLIGGFDVSSLKFGTSGLRGLVTDLVGLPAYSFVRAFCAMIAEIGAEGAGREVLIGRDLRASSPEIAGQCACAVADAGLYPIDCGAVPTPALAMMAMRRRVAAIMVTGSHIPEDRNGLKFYLPSGEIDKAAEERILNWHARLSLSAMPAVSAKAGRIEALAEYCARYEAFFAPAMLEGLTIGVYQHSTVGRDVIADLLATLGAEVVRLGRAECFIPVDTEALRPEDEELVRGWGAERRFDALVSADGDADRPLIADGEGRFLRGDLVGALTAAYLGADTVVTPVTSNSALERCGLFQRVVRTKVGSPFVIAGMAEAQAGGAQTVVGFEANGGTLLGSAVERHGRRLAALPTRDAMLPILAVLATVARSDETLASLVARQGFAVALSSRLPNVPQERSSIFIAALGDEASQVSRIAFAARGGIVARNGCDGLRLTFNDGTSVHYRASGNAPELRVYVEAENPEGAEILLQEGMRFAESWIAAMPNNELVG